ncbi:Zn-ribbon domain-containing OB-fold protein [Alicyclobacillus mengziensis]|uniref:Zn-ribbon domain-containing OB-fold protein n=1 Tax=Alicyclobacillus mengziensis TaxID=2931921 RepID=A0A9X7W400_9BACL|nr:Zn-ribbon domain-containing OB-fold protein [Alicyclobacillus mengziensis]QSO49934.1 Zn-ribbon domain-containing OB-fold protein [Alicyclobacillus mengziensis]
MFPRPVLDSDSAPFWEGLQRHELWIQRCDDCEKYIFYPRSICPHCFSTDVSYVKAAGTGVIYSYTVVHRAFGPFAAEAPFVVGLVDLDEGVRMMARIRGLREEVAIGERVRVAFEYLDDGLTLPAFERVK